MAPMLATSALRSLLESTRALVLADAPGAFECANRFAALSASDLIQLDGLARCGWVTRSA